MEKGQSYVSKSLKIMLAILVVLLVGGGAYWYFVMREDSASADGSSTLPTVSAQAPTTSTSATDPCPDPAAAATATTATTPTATTATTPGAAPAGGATTDPAAAPATAMGNSDGSARVTAAGADVSGFASDSLISAAEATAVPAGTETQTPTPISAVPAEGAAGSTPAPDASTTSAVPATSPAPGTGSAGATAATVDPCVDPATGKPTTAATTPGGAKTPAQPRLVGEGTNTGVNSESLRMAKAISAVGTKAQLTFAVQVTLSPTAGGQETRPAALKRYRKNVRAAVVRIKLTDQTSLQQWTTTKRSVRSKTVQTFLNQLRSNYPNAVRSVAMVGPDENLLAVGDVAPGGSVSVKIYG